MGKHTKSAIITSSITDAKKEKYLNRQIEIERNCIKDIKDCLANARKEYHHEINILLPQLTQAKEDEHRHITELYKVKCRQKKRGDYKELLPKNQNKKEENNI